MGFVEDFEKACGVGTDFDFGIEKVEESEQDEFIERHFIDFDKNIDKVAEHLVYVLTDVIAIRQMMEHKKKSTKD